MHDFIEYHRQGAKKYPDAAYLLFVFWFIHVLVGVMVIGYFIGYYLGGL